MSYKPHRSKRLQRIFRKQCYQGAPPETTEFLFVDFDANFDPGIEDGPVWDATLEYLTDGVAFWQKYGIHHPFLLQGYQSDGHYFHENFAKIGFTPEDAGRVSFVELVNEPTEGRNKLTVDDLNMKHLSWLNKLIINSAARHIFVPPGVGKLMIKSREFPWLTRKYETQKSGLGIWARLGATGRTATVYRNYHFSVHYGWQVESLSQHIKAIRAITRRK